MHLSQIAMQLLCPGWGTYVVALSQPFFPTRPIVGDVHVCHITTVTVSSCDTAHGRENTWCRKLCGHSLRQGPRMGGNPVKKALSDVEFYFAAFSCDRGPRWRTYMVLKMPHIPRTYSVGNAAYTVKNGN